MKNIFSIRSPYHKVPDLILEDAIMIARNMFPGKDRIVVPALTALVNLMRKDLVCWTFMLNRAIMEEDEFYLLIQSRKEKLIIAELASWGFNKDMLAKFANEFIGAIYSTIVSSQQLGVTSENILSLLYSLAVK